MHHSHQVTALYRSICSYEEEKNQQNIKIIFNLCYFMQVNKSHNFQIKIDQVTKCTKTRNLKKSLYILVQYGIFV